MNHTVDHRKIRSDSEVVIRPLFCTDLAALENLERASWPESLSATGEKTRRRLDLGHQCIVAAAGNELISAICFVATAQDPTVTAGFPKTFSEYSSVPYSQPVLSLYVYSLCVRPEWRGKPSVYRVLEAACEAGRQSGARYLVGDGRCPSFNGADGIGPDRVQRNDRFRTTVLQWHQTGVRPTDAEIMADPVLKFYRRTLSCRYLHLAPHFIPEDHASGGYRVIFVSDL